MPVLRFDVFEVASESGELRKRGSRLRLRDQAMRALLALIQNAGQVVTREQLRHALWPDGTVVDFERAINRVIHELREALGDSSSNPRFIETLSKRGYRFVCAVAPTQSGTSVVKVEPIHTDAQMAYLTGRYLWNRRTVPDLHASIGWFDQALAIDDRCATAYAGLADAKALLGIWGLLPSDRAFGLARQAAERALTLDPNLAEAYTSIGEVLKGYEWRWREAEQQYRHALSLRPGYAPAHHCYAQLLVVLHRFRQAAAHIELARRADPVSPAINAYLPYIYLAGRDYDRALREGKRAVALEPHSPLAHWALGRAYLFSNHKQDGVDALASAAALADGASMWTAALCHARARAGDRSGASRLLANLLERARHEHVCPCDLAIAFTGLGDRASALEQLEQAFEQRAMRIITLGDPEFDCLHAEPRYTRLRDRLGLPRRS